MLLKWKEMFHSQIYTFLICLIYFLELLLCYISVPLVWVRMEAGKKRLQWSYSSTSSLYKWKWEHVFFPKVSDIILQFHHTFLRIVLLLKNCSSRLLISPMQDNSQPMLPSESMTTFGKRLSLLNLKLTFGRFYGTQVWQAEYNKQSGIIFHHI